MFNGSETVSLSDNNPALMSRRKYLGDKALHLRIVEEFLSQLEFTLLKVPTEQFNFEPVRNSIHELKSLADDENPDRRKRVEFQLAHELLRWQEYLTLRDDKIEAYHIRRYCDGLLKPLDNEVFVALARFYRDMPRSKNSLSKFDLAMTRAFSTRVNDLFRAMATSRDEIAARTAALYCSWDRVVSVDLGSPRDVAVFDKFLVESDTMQDFQTLTVSRLFDRIRQFKAEIGDRFWDPTVVAAAIECNIVVGNHLNGLMARASENLGERLGSEFDFAGAFQDTSPNTGAHISEVLREIEKEPLLVAETESEDVKFLRSLLELTETVQDDSDADEAVTKPATDANEILSIDELEFTQMLALLGQHNPDTRSLAAFCAKSDLGIGFELDDFLFGSDQLPDELGREVLSVILSLEAFRQNELHERKLLPLLVKNKVMNLLSRAEDLGKKIERSLETDPGAGARRLKIANKLLETRLRAERSVVKFTSRGLGMVPEARMQASELEQLPSTFSYFDYAGLSANRWVVGATIAVAIISAFLYFSAGNAEASLADDVEILEPARLAGGDDLTSAHRHGSTLYLVAKETWRTKSETDKTNLLKDLISTPSKTKLETVLVVDWQGQHLADMSPMGVNINDAPPAYDVEGLR
jgi:hypothetical protein